IDDAIRFAWYRRARKGTPVIAVGRHRQMLSLIRVTAGNHAQGAVLGGSFVNREPHRHPASFNPPEVGLLMPRNFEAMRRLLEKLCPEQHHVVTENLSDGMDYLRKGAELINQPPIKVAVKSELLFRRKRLIRRRWKREHFP